MERTVNYLKSDFRFKKFDLNLKSEVLKSDVFSPDYNDSDWRKVRVPHDWGIEDEFKEENDLSITTITQDGMLIPFRHSGRTGALPTVGIGVYRKWVDIPKNDKVFLELDGVMWESRVYCNGILVGSCHFGYKSYSLDITDAADFEKPNLICIYAEVKPDCSRWYTGGGLYRNIKLITKPKEYIEYNGISINNIYLDKQTAIMDLSIEATHSQGFTAVITDPKGNKNTYYSSDNSLIFHIENPVLWDANSPKLYEALIKLESGDFETVKFGIKDIVFSNEGLRLNGRYIKLNGVCMHHDQGSIGAAVNKSAIRRQIEILKGMGVNALRTSHNPPAPELLDLCDEMGILVMDEFFDEWEIPKVKNGYSNYFKENAFKDALSFIKRDKNHPSVIMWSIGNEIPEQDKKDGWKLAKLLYETVKKADPSRPVAQGFDHYDECLDNHMAFYTDIVGLNYKAESYEKLHKKYPNLLILGSETASCVSTRGVYHFPAKVKIGKHKSEDLAISAYELNAPDWAYYPERELAGQKDCPYVLGEFIWTGFDYLGEPTPYYQEWPARSSYFGVVDLCGLPKNRYYLYRSVWTDIPTLHIFPHWTWPEKEGKVTPVHVYSNYDEVELIVNGISQGRKSFNKEADKNLLPEIKAERGAHIGRFRLMWDNVIYKAGEITAIGYKNGVEKERKTIKTAGTPHHIELSAYQNTFKADGESLNYVTASIVDKNGNLCPHENTRLRFCVSGEAELISTDAGDQRETEMFSRPDKKALGGMLVACIRSTQTEGEITLTCGGENLLEGKISLKTLKN